MATTAGRLLGAMLDERKPPWAPAAIRVERSSARGDGADAHQTALTVWFGQGPSLPSPAASRPAVRTVVGAVAGIAGVVALGALGVLAAQRDPRLLEASGGVHRLAQPGETGWARRGDGRSAGP